MSTATLPDNKEDQDQAHNPGQADYERKFNGEVSPNDLKRFENAPNLGEEPIDFDSISDYANRAGPVAAARDQEQAGAGFVSNFTGGKQKESLTLKGFLKKKGALGFIAAITFGGFGLLSVLFSPSILIVHVKEVLLNDLNDQATALDIRSKAVMAARMQKETTSGLCTGKVSVACKFKRTSAKQIQRFNNAKIEVVCDGPCDKRFGNRIVSLRFEDGTVIDDPAKFKSTMINSTVARSAMNRAYNPVFFGMWDKVANRSLAKMGISKAHVLDGKNTEENIKKIRQAGNIPAKDGKPLTPLREDKNDPNKITGYQDSDGKRYTLEEGQKIADAAKTLGETAPGAASKVARGLVRSVGVLGASGTACDAIKGLEVLGMGAKLIRTAQAVQATYPLLNEADTIIAGKSTQASAEAVGKILTEADTDEEAIDDTGKTSPNPAKGKTFTDSPGFLTASSGKPHKLSSADAQFMVGTPLSGVLENLARLARTVVNPTACGVINNPWVQAGSTIAGIAAAIFTGGLSTAQIVAQGAFAITVAVGMSYAEAMLQDMAAGNMETLFKNHGAGNMAFVGTSEILQRIGGGRGMPYQTDANVSEFNKIRAEVQQQNIEVAKFEGQKDPLNPLLPYSFAGILARNLLPLQTSTSPLSKVAEFASLPLKSLQTLAFPNLYALNAKPYDPSRYEKCQDETYKELGIKADIFCNLRRAMTQTQLGMDPAVTADWMEAKGYLDSSKDAENIDAVDLALGDYKKFYDNCVLRPEYPPGISEEDGDDNWKNKKNCVKPIDIDQETFDHFVVFTIDYSIIQGLDEDVEDVGGAFGGGSGGGDGSLVTGEAKELARKLANNENIQFVNPKTKEGLVAFADGKPITNSCGASFSIDSGLSGVMLGLSNKYKVYVNNLGFGGAYLDRYSCDSGQHPKGKAVDINGIEIIGGAKTSWGSITFNSAEVPVITSYANDWLKLLAPNRGGVGQLNCGGFKVTPPPGATGINGNLHFEDSCDHLHIDVRDRGGT